LENIYGLQKPQNIDATRLWREATRSTSLEDWCPTFRNNVVVASSRVEYPVIGHLALKMRPL